MSTRKTALDTWRNRRMHHMQNQRLKLAEFRLLREIREQGETPKRAARLAKIRATLYPQVWGKP